MRLVPDWREAWKWISMWAFGLLTALPLVWVGLPPDLKAYIPPEWGIYILIFVAAGGGIGRVVDQNRPPK